MKCHLILTVRATFKKDVSGILSTQIKHTSEGYLSADRCLDPELSHWNKVLDKDSPDDVCDWKIRRVFFFGPPPVG